MRACAAAQELLKFRRAGADSASVSEDTAGGSRRAELLAAMLRHERALVAAIAPEGVLVPIPESVALPAHRVITAPTGWATMADLVAPGDTLAVVAAWEQARAHGVGFGSVHARTDPDEALSLTFLD